MSARKELFELDTGADDLPKLQEESAEGEAGGNQPCKTPPGTVLFNAEELGLYAVAVVVLVFVAYFAGAYASRGRNSQPVVEPTMNVLAYSEKLLPDATGQPPVPPPPFPAEGAAPASQATAEPPAVPATAEKPRYTLEVIRFRIEDRLVAIKTVEKLQKLGYVPAFLSDLDDEIGVCVGKFVTRNDKTGLRWRQEIRNIHAAYCHCDFVPLK